MIQFEGAIYGTNAFVHGNWFERAWGKIMGNREYTIFGHSLGGPYTATGGSVYHTLFFSVRHKPGTFPLFLKMDHQTDSINDVPIRLLGIKDVYHASTVGSMGFRDPAAYLTAWANFSIYVPPTRSDTIRVVAMQGTNTIELGSFDVLPMPMR